MNTGEDPNVHVINRKVPDKPKPSHKFTNYREKPPDKYKSEKQGAIPKSATSKLWSTYF